MASERRNDDGTTGRETARLERRPMLLDAGNALGACPEAESSNKPESMTGQGGASPPTNIEAVRDLMVSADGIEATYGRNPYSDYLRKHKRYPDKATAEGLGGALGGRVRADDGKMYPAKAKRKK